MSKKIIAKSGGQLQPERPGHFHPEKGGQFHPEKAGVLIRNIHVRTNFILLWTAFIAELEHEKVKKDNEYKRWENQNNGKTYKPDDLVFEIMEELKKKQGSPIA